MSLPMTGPVADVSKSGYQGYELWASQVNAAGGLLGRQVKLDMLDDGFDPNQTAADYTRLISQDHVNLLLGTFSSLLNAPASAVAARQGMLYVEPSGGAATLFTRGFTDLFFAQPGTTTSLPDQFVAWIASLPASERPATAAYVTQDDPSASPAVAVFKTRLQALGVKTVYYQVYDPSTTNFDSIAAAIAHAQPQMIIQGAVADDGAQFVRSLQKLSYNPKILFQTNAPTDEAYPSAIGGAGNADGVFTAQSWSSTATYPGNQASSRRTRRCSARRPPRTPRTPTPPARSCKPPSRPSAASTRRARELAARPHGQHHRRPAEVGQGRRPGRHPAAVPVAARHPAGRRPGLGRHHQDRPAHQARLGQRMTELLQALIFGVLTGGVYALMATGLTLTFGVMKIVNMAQGAFLILSAYLCWTLWAHLGIDPLLGSLIVTVPLAALGIVVYRFIVERVQRHDHGLTIVVTFAVALVAEAIIALIWGPNPAAATPAYFNQAFTLGSVTVPRAQLYACLLAVAVTVALQTVLTSDLARPRDHRRRGEPGRCPAHRRRAEADRHLDLRHRHRDHRFRRRGAQLPLPVHPGLAGHLDRPDAQRGHPRRPRQRHRRVRRRGAARPRRVGHVDVYLGPLVRSGPHDPHPPGPAHQAAGAVHPGRQAGRRRMNDVRRTLIALALVALAVFPLVSDDLYYQAMLILTFLLAIGATGWNIMGGYAGYISLGNSAFIGLGAYTTGILAAKDNVSPFLGCLAGGLVAAAAAAILSLVTRRTRGMYFIIVTFAALQLLGIVATIWSGLTGGSQGLALPIPTWSLAYQNWPFYYPLLALLVLAVAVSAWVRRSKLGLGLFAIQDDEGKAAGLGLCDQRLQADRVRPRRHLPRRRGRHLRLLRDVPQRQRRVRHRHEHADRAVRAARRTRHPLGPGPRRVRHRAPRQPHEHQPGRRRRRRDPLAAVRRPARPVVLFLPRGLIPTVSAWKNQRHTQDLKQDDPERLRLPLAAQMNKEADQPDRHDLAPATATSGEGSGTVLAVPPCPGRSAACARSTT